MLFEALGRFLLGLSAGLTMSAITMADADATNRAAVRAQQRVSGLRRDADARLWTVYGRYAGTMGPHVRAEYRRRLAT
jgi:hypothetical protein